MPAMNQQCKVCSEPAAGFHFGAFTCEGCKSFFGRTYNNMATIGECKNNNKCIINKKNRTACKACRLRKCLYVGMSKSGSRYGRRSNWFKIHCLLAEQNNTSQNMTTIPAIPTIPTMPAMNTISNVAPFAPAYGPLQGLIPQVQHIGNLYPDKQDFYQSLANFPGARRAGTSSESGRSSVDCVETESCNSPSSYSQVNAASPSLPERESIPPRRNNATVTLTTGYPHQNLGLVYPPALVTPANAQASPRGGDLYQVSPSPGGLAVEQDEPIDLSIKSSRTSSRRSASEEEDNRLESHKEDETTNKSSTPLDLTLGVKSPKKEEESL